MQIKVAVADDHTLFRKSLAMLINTFDNIEVVAEAECGASLLKKLEQTKPDVVLVDIQMPVMDGYQTCKNLRVKHPGIKILIVSQFNDKDSVHRGLQSGAHGFFTKTSDPAQLEVAIKSVAEKGVYFDTGLTSVLHDIILRKDIAEDPLACLSEREMQIIRLASKGLDTDDIGTALFINRRTVETHRRRIMEKTSSKNFVAVVLLALKHRHILVEEL